MKTIFSTFLLMIAVSYTANAQSGNPTDYYVVDKIYESFQEMQNSMKESENAMFIRQNTPNAIQQITSFIEEKSVENLHIYVSCKPGSMVFNSIAITPENIDVYSQDFVKWSDFISGEVIIHSEWAFYEDQGRALKDKLQKTTGLNFQVMSN